jgi:hypothetical protein
VHHIHAIHARSHQVQRLGSLAASTAVLEGRIHSQGIQIFQQFPQTNTSYA